MPYDIDSIRKKLKSTIDRRSQDPDEFKPGKAKSPSDPIKYVFFILPPVPLGARTANGITTQAMEQFFITNANHWVEERPYPCPRVWDNTDCKICDFGFEMLKEEGTKNNKELRAKIIRQWMPTQYYMMNIYFPNHKLNPEDLRGRVMFYNAPKTVIDQCSGCLLRDDEGPDPESKEAFGVFFDEYASYLFELQVLKHGENNSYKTSKFRPRIMPIAAREDGSPHEELIDSILARRHDLFSKIEVPRLEDIDRVFKKINEGEEPDATGGFDHTEELVKSSKTVAGNPKTGKQAAVVIEEVMPATSPVKTQEPIKSPAEVILDDEDDVVPITKLKPTTKNPLTPKKDTVSKEVVAPTTSLKPKTTVPVAEPIVDPKSDGTIEALLAQIEDD